MCQSDLYPTCYDLEPIRLDQEPVKPSITELEQRALNIVDVAEKVSEPINKFKVARGVVRVAASLARARRDRSTGGL
jgi:hypothetical protein